MRLLKRIKNKRGDALIFSYIIVTLAIFFTAFIVDIGLGYASKAQLQTISDAAAIGGASKGEEAYTSMSDHSKIAIVNEAKAYPEATYLVQQNSRYLMSEAQITSQSYNPSGEVVQDNQGTMRALNWRDQYYTGNFTVVLKGELQTFFSKFTNIPYLNYSVKSRVHVTPQ